MELAFAFASFAVLVVAWFMMPGTARTTSHATTKLVETREAA